MELREICSIIISSPLNFRRRSSSIMIATEKNTILFSPFWYESIMNQIEKISHKKLVSKIVRLNFTNIEFRYIHRVLRELIEKNEGKDINVERSLEINYFHADSIIGGTIYFNEYNNEENTSPLGAMLFTTLQKYSIEDF